MKPLSKSFSMAGLAVLLSLSALPAQAGVKKDGAWPSDEKKVSFEFEGAPKEGLEKLAEEAGWSLVLAQNVATSDHDVKIRVKDQPADAVLDALFAESDVVARRSGNLVTVLPAGAPPAAAAPVPPAPPAPPMPTVRGEDRNVLGSSLRVHKGEVVHTVTVTGGSAHIEGTVTGDLVVAGGSAHVDPGGRVLGNVEVIGGSLHLEKDARVDGDVGVVGGAVHREEGSFIGGKVVDSANGDPGNIEVKVHDGEVKTKVTSEGAGAKVAKAAHSFGQTMAKMALLFVYGCVLLALATRRMDQLRVEAAAKPMRSFALGVVGSIGIFVALCVACLTIVGIPFAALAVLLLFLAIYGAVAAVLTTVGAALLQHKTESPYVHLLAGCALLLVLLAIPYVGGIVAFGLAMVSIGTLVSTRGAGLLARRAKSAQSTAL